MACSVGILCHASSVKDQSPPKKRLCCQRTLRLQMEGYWSPQSDSKNEKSLIVGSANYPHWSNKTKPQVPCTQLQKHRNFDLFCRPSGSDVDTIPFSQNTADMWTNSSCCRYRTQWFRNISNTCYNTVRSGGR